MSPRILYRTLAIAEVITWALLLTAMFLKYVTQTTDAWVTPAGGIHGFVFLSYGAMTIFVWINQKWKPGVGVLGLVSAIVPFATLPFDIAIDKRGLLNGGWRLAPGGEKPSGFFEHVQAMVLRRPIVWTSIAAVVIAGVFTVLLILGPPIPISA